MASVLVISVIWCIARCLCCGASCCCGCLSCCDSCCPSGGRHGKQSKYVDHPSPFQPAPYQGYQPTPAPPVYSQPPQFAQFDVTKRNKTNEDALPAMPSWETASQRKVLEEHKDEDMELGNLDPAKAPMLAHQAPSPRTGYLKTDSSFASRPYQQHGTQNGGDLGNPSSQGRHDLYDNPYPNSPASPPRYNDSGFGSHQQGYQGSHYQQSYSAYAPSESTKYEPSSYGQQESGVAYASRSPHPVQQPYHSHAPSVLQAGRKPVQNSWREI